MTRRIPGVILRLAILSLCLTAGPAATVRDQASKQESRKEPLSEASKHWLDEVVPYIVTSKEKAVFISLLTEVDRGQFIETFWKRRDPNPKTPDNEFKIEFYKRVAAANKLFSSGSITGWRTDRGRFYILLGPPNEILRDMNPGTSGKNAASAFQGSKETWDYYGLPNPNLPYNIELVFVDKFGTGNLVLENSFDRSANGSKQLDSSDLTYQFNRQEIVAEAQKNPFEGFDKLKEIITTQVSYAHIPFRANIFYFKGKGEETVVPIILEISPALLTAKSANHMDYYSLNLILNVSNSLGQLVFEKGKDINFKERSRGPGSPPQNPVLIETAITLEPGSYVLHELILDNFSGKIGTSHKEISVPSFLAGDLKLSSILLSSSLPATLEKEAVSSAQEKVRTRTASRFRSGDEMNVYFEIYNLSLNPETGLNRFKVEYAFLREGALLISPPSSPITPSAEKDCRVQTSFRLKNFKPGDYALRIKVVDEQSGIDQTLETPLTIAD